jgi:hypothetical protein
MMRPKRLLADRPTDLERMLLEGALKERPSDAQRMRVREALWQAAPASTKTGAGAGSTVATKAAIIGAIGAAIVGLALLQRARPSRGELTDADVPAPSVVHNAEGAVAPTVLALDSTPPITQLASRPNVESRSAVSSKARLAAEGARVRAATQEVSDVRDQIRMIDEARAAMDHRDASSALGIVDRYAAKYPDGMFRQEARILRILALDDRGDHARATSLARAFLASYPTSAHVARIEHIAAR